MYFDESKIGCAWFVTSVDQETSGIADLIKLRDSAASRIHELSASIQSRVEQIQEQIVSAELLVREQNG